MGRRFDLRTMDQDGTPRGIRTHTVRILSPLPLPVGLREYNKYSLEDTRLVVTQVAQVFLQETLIGVST